MSAHLNLFESSSSSEEEEENVIVCHTQPQPKQGLKKIYRDRINFEYRDQLRSSF